MLKGIFDIFHAMKKTSIEIYEWEESNVRKKRLANAPLLSALAVRHRNLKFSGCELAHAVVKADYLDRRNLAMPGIGFLLQACSVIDFSVPTIELRPGASKSLNDVSLSSMAGRVGQGLAILYGHSLGMKFAAHLRSHVESLPIGSAGAVHKGDAMADFVFASNQKSLLVESKGSFTLQENDPSQIKTVLKAALTGQIDPWMDYLQPAPSNGYVMYSCLREGTWQPSAMFIVDPDGDANNASEVPLSIEQVMRENYGAWLYAMGFTDSAKRLLHPLGDFESPVQHVFLVIEINQRKFAFPRHQFIKNPYYRSRAFSHSIGIDLLVLEAISSVLQSKRASLQDLLANHSELSAFSKYEASVFPDGSVVGLINPYDHHFEFKPIVL